MGSHGGSPSCLLGLNHLKEAGGRLIVIVGAYPRNERYLGCELGRRALGARHPSTSPVCLLCGGQSQRGKRGPSWVTLGPYSECTVRVDPDVSMFFPLDGGIEIPSPSGHMTPGV